MALLNFVFEDTSSPKRDTPLSLLSISMVHTAVFPLVLDGTSRMLI
jgi:hypothetical protein